MRKVTVATLLSTFALLASHLLLSSACPLCPYPVPSPPPPINSPPPPPTNPPPQGGGTCPIDALKLSACVELLGGLVQIGVGASPTQECCPVLNGLVGLDAGLCLCTALKLKVLNVNIFIPLALGLLVSCGKDVPSGFQCLP
ncbi:hypothetical protein HPP92_012060 [Vanilla planifolia]|uniref:Bifunctional inhibitor/plant lipid transfer protein/seed storage helical domain-containing protein n=1 Tax=Vanilla planifolia TaxID=51239 RepID=A0A835R783_VANPL|nr:hypothetical protein HPP92_012060 [Vanilla planifolia]